MKIKRNFLAQYATYVTTYPIIHCNVCDVNTVEHIRTRECVWFELFYGGQCRRVSSTSESSKCGNQDLQDVFECPANGKELFYLFRLTNNDVANKNPKRPILLHVFYSEVIHCRRSMHHTMSNEEYMLHLFFNN